MWVNWPSWNKMVIHKAFHVYRTAFTFFLLVSMKLRAVIQVSGPLNWVCVCVFTLSCISRVWLSVTPRTVAHQAPLSMGFFRQDHWSGVPFPSSRGFLDPGIEPASPVSPALAGGCFTTEPPQSMAFKNCESQYCTPITYINIVH